MNRRVLGIASTLIGASLWGFSGTCSQFLVQNYAISSLFITMMRMLGAATLFLVVILVRYRAQVREALSSPWARRQLALFGVCGLFLSQITYVIAIGYTNAGTTTVLQSLNIVIIMLVTCVMSRRSPRPLELLGLVLALVATVLISTQGDLGTMNIPPMGLFWGLASAVAAACYSMLGGPLYPKWGSFPVVGMGMIAGGIVAAAFWALAFAFPGIDAVASAGNPCGSALMPTLDAWGWFVLLAVSVVGTFGAFFLFLNGVSMVGAMQGSQLGAIEPVSATECSAVLTGTVFSLYDWAGLVLMVGTIILVAAGGDEGAQQTRRKGDNP